jgi:hypothetical protein
MRSAAAPHAVHPTGPDAAPRRASIPLDVVDRLLGAGHDLPGWRVADLANRGRILATWLSTVEARGERIGPQAQAYLDRIRERTAQLHALGADLAGAYGLTVLKGERIARHLPPPVLRQSGDVDLVAPSEEHLWRCVQGVRSRVVDAAIEGVSVMDDPAGAVHLMVAMKWPAAEPLLDKPMGVDITTFAFGGDFRTVPLRAVPPPDEALAGLFAVAEERFQRRFRVKDHLDMLVLAEVLEHRFGDDLIEVVCDHAADLALAPELLRLIGGADEWVPVPARWQLVRDALVPLARAEKDRRRPGRPGVHRLRFGYPLDEPAGGPPAVRILSRAGGDLALTPVGPCLLSERLVIEDDHLAAAIEFARSLATRPT